MKRIVPGPVALRARRFVWNVAAGSDWIEHFSFLIVNGHDPGEEFW
jgi:hypothetical protein